MEEKDNQEFENLVEIVKGVLQQISKKRAKVLLRDQLMNMGYNGNALLLDDEYMERERQSTLVHVTGTYYTSTKGIPSLAEMEKSVYNTLIAELYDRLTPQRREMPQWDEPQKQFGKITNQVL